MIQISSLFLNDFPKAICLARDIENKYCHDRLGNETVKYIAVFIGYGKWIVREIEQPKGVVLDEKAYEVNISKAEQVVEIEIVNEYVHGKENEATGE